MNPYHNWRKYFTIDLDHSNVIALPRLQLQVWIQ